MLIYFVENAHVFIFIFLLTLLTLFFRKPLFPGKNFVHQLQLIFEVIGSPTSSQVRFGENMHDISKCLSALYLMNECKKHEHSLQNKSTSILILKILKLKENSQIIFNVLSLSTFCN